MKLNIAVAQLGPIQKADDRTSVVRRLMALLHEAASRGAQHVVFPELALTTFFPRWLIEDRAELLAWYEKEMPNPVVAPLFELASQLGVSFSLGYAEAAQKGADIHLYNTFITVSSKGEIIGKYRKIHVPGHAEFEAYRPHQHLEKRYFEMGDLGFPVFDLQGVITGALICNDRRWPEAWRSLSLQGASLVVVGYNTTMHNPEISAHDGLVPFHHLLSMQAGAYQNGVWAAAAGKAGREEGGNLLNLSCIIAPTGEVAALATGLGDEVITACCDFDRCAEIKGNIFNFALHRKPEQYGLLTQKLA